MTYPWTNLAEHTDTQPIVNHSQKKRQPVTPTGDNRSFGHQFSSADSLLIVLIQ